jgi:hypothetical protein
LVRVLNWVGLAASLATFGLISVSLFMPWWQLVAGDGLAAINASPVNTNFSFFGNSFTVPIINAFTIVIAAMLLVSAFVMLAYSLLPTKPYAKTLLNFAYKIPIYALILFLAALIVVVLSIQAAFNIGIPIMGTATLTLPAVFTGDSTISAAVTGSFLLPFWLAIASAALCIATRVYDGKIRKAFFANTNFPSPRELQDTIKV